MRKIIIISDFNNATEAEMHKVLQNISSQTYTDFLHEVWVDGRDRRILDSVLPLFPDYPVCFVDVQLGTRNRKYYSDYICFHDVNTTWKPSFLDTMIFELDSKGNDTRMVICDSKLSHLTANKQTVIDKAESKFIPGICPIVKDRMVLARSQAVFCATYSDDLNIMKLMTKIQRDGFEVEFIGKSLMIGDIVHTHHSTKIVNDIYRLWHNAAVI